MDNTLNNPKDKGEKRGVFSIAQLYDSYFSITGPNVLEAVNFSCYV